VTRSGDSRLWNITYDNFMTGASKPWYLPAQPFLWSVKYNVKNTYSMQYLFNIQRELSQDTVLEAGYNASLSRHAQGLQDPNAPLPGTTNSTLRMPYSEFGIIQTVHSESTANYHGMGLKLTRRMSKGMTFLASYTWSKSLDSASAIRGTSTDIFPQNNYCIACDYGYAAYNTPHRFVTSALWEVPLGKGRKYLNTGGVVNAILGGWQIGSIVTIQSGRPVNMTAGGYNSSGTNKYGEVRLSATGEDPYLQSGSSSQWLNTAAFAPAPKGFFGNITRNRLIGPSTFQWDFSTQKSFRIREGHELQFRFESFNFPNHPNWGGVDANPTSVSFGMVTGKSSERNIQLSLRYSF
jgi:hypothetical protein